MDKKELFSLLVCPKCRGKLAPLPDADAAEGLQCSACQCVYPVREGIPVMLMEEAVSCAQWQAGVRSKGEK